MRHRLPQFNHLFAGDAYSAGYYSYLWSDVMDADTWKAIRGGGRRLGSGDGGPVQDLILSRATRPTGPRPIASSAGATRT